GAVSVPGCVRGWAMLLERFGTRPLAALLAPAVHYADAGFPTTRLLSQAIEDLAPAAADPEWRRIFAPGGRAPRLAERLRQPDLAETLRLLAAEGPERFYQRRNAHAIASRLESDGFPLPRQHPTHTAGSRRPP